MLAAPLSRKRSASSSRRRAGGGGSLAEDGFLASVEPAMEIVEEQALRVACSDETVLLLGETGVGKDIMARRIHEASQRSGGPFVHVNCAALPDGLLESELFGHERGAYTGADATRPGQFEAASGGTIFLDEIAEMSPRLQAKLLHVLQDKVVQRVGGREPIRVDVRIIAATNQDLDRSISSGNFRSDLFYRLCVICLKIPPLRERKADIERLARHFAKKYAALFNKPSLARLDEAVISGIMLHPFEGNVRELENLIKRGILLGSYDVILNEIAARFDVAKAFRAAAGRLSAIEGGDGVQPLKEVTRHAIEKAERTEIVRALTATRWNRRRAARLLKVSYRSLLYKISDYSILPGTGKGTC